MRRRRIVALLCVITVMNACGGSGGGTTSGAPTTSDDPEVSATSATSPTDATDTSTEPADPADTTATSATTPQEPATSATEIADLDALAVITISNPPTGNGERPLLQWEPVDGATRFAVTLAEPDGAVYWAWAGTGESIWLGGQQTEPPADAAGPVLLAELVMRVVAFDASDAIVAASAPTPIAP